MSERLDSLISAKTEALQGKYFPVTVVFGQGPVQEQQGIPKAGRKGLNFFSRLIGLAAAEMLQSGLTDKVIVSGGKTGGLGVKSEGELIADVITRRLSTSSTRPGQYKTIQGEYKPIASAIVEENAAKDSLQNLAFVLQNPEVQRADQIAFLGIGHHAYDTHSKAGIGRLEVLGDIFGLPISTFSAEGIMRQAVKRYKAPIIKAEMTRLTDIALNHQVSKLKSKQENVLVKGLRVGDWKRIAPYITDTNFLKSMIIRDPYMMRMLQRQFRINSNDIAAMGQDDLLNRLTELKVLGSRGYDRVKKGVAEVFERMTKRTGVDYTGKYFKPTFNY